VKAPVSWLREFADVPADVNEVAGRLAGCGFAVDGIEGDVVDFDVTANRPDCLSVYGLAREAAVAFGTPLKALAPAAPPAGPTPVKVSLGDPGCSRYALALLDVRVAPSPDWLATRLREAGVRPINNVVDVTNYVMLEMGHPMHAFDLAKLAGTEIHVRRARASERLTTLDGETRVLDETMLVIADRDRAVAVAGVMGGASSEVSGMTSRIALESAWFWPASVRATSRKLGLKTEASMRFERGADIAAPVAAVLRALAIFKHIGAGSAVAGIADVYPRVAVARQVALRRARVTRLLGQSIDDKDITRILEQLGFRLQPAADGWQVEVPSFRVDVAREADLIEEIGRHWGFDKIPATLPPLRQPPPVRSFGVTEDSRLRGLARGAGLQEAVTFTFIERAAAEPFAAPGDDVVAIANPLSEKFAVLRPSMLPGLVDALIYNRRRESDVVRLFELGSIFRPSGEATAIGWVLTGRRLEHWAAANEPLDFFDAKGVAELLIRAFGADAEDIRAEAADDLPWYVRGRSARLRIGDGAKPVGHVGQIRPEILAARGLDSGLVVGGELDLDELRQPRAGDERTAAIEAVPRYPSIVRDLSIVVPERLPAAEVRGTIRSTAPPTLASVVEFDRYQGKGVPDGHVSLSMRLTFRDADRTLTDAEVQQAVDAIVRTLARSHGATLRGQ
jgi:phenylalanyl-tRNA synthetase beta chain